jgi:hypothetical protein
MSLHRALLCSIGAAMLVGSVGCDVMGPSQSASHPGSKSESNMHRTQWNVSGEEKPQVPAPEAGAPAQAPAPAK